jgi:predicted enzyme related to lactoylglutathione lyase
VWQDGGRAIGNLQEDTMANQIVWCDIPVLDLDRAIRFYECVLGASVKKHELSGTTVGILPHGDGEVGACLFTCDATKAGDSGVMIYLNCNGRLDAAAEAAVVNGGKVLQPKHSIGPFGFRAIVMDSEGNRIALHSD